MKMSLALHLTILLSCSFILSIHPAKAGDEKEIRKEKEQKDPVPARERQTQDGERPREGDRPRPDREAPPRQRKEVRKDGEAPRREGERRAEGDREREAVRARRLNAVFYKVQSPSVLVVGVGDSGKEMLLPIEKDTKIYLSGKPAVIGDLKPDMQLSVQQEAGLTRRIDARPPRARGPRDTGRKAVESDRGKDSVNPARERERS